MDGWLTAPWLVAPCAALGLSAVLTGLARQIAPAVGLVDKPDGGRKLHHKPTPVMGGAAFFTTMVIVVGCAALLQQAWIRDPQTTKFATSLFSSAVLFCALGVIDDRFALRPRTKLMGQVIASLPFACLTQTTGFVQLLGYEIPLGALAVPFLVFWLVACSNVINLIDGLDGLAGTVGLISMLTVAALFAGQEQMGAATIALIAAGSIGGFLIHNWPPARIFMGDGGSLTIGYLVGALSIQASSKTATGFTLAVPLVLISVPIFDTFMAVMRRKLNGRGIGEGDRGHIHHRLQDQGLSRKQALLAIGGLSLVMAAAAYTTAKLDNEMAGLMICGAVLVMLIVGRIFGYHETVLFYRHIQELGVLLLDTSGVLQTRFLLARMNNFEPRQRHELWRKVCDRVGQMGGTRLEFQCTADGDDVTGGDLFWRGSEPASDQAGAAWEFVYSVPRPDGLVATLSASGFSPTHLPAPRFDDLFRLFSRVCRDLPVELDTTEDVQSLPMPQIHEPARKAA